MLLSAKYNPKTINDIKLQDKAMDTVISWANGWLKDLPNPEKPALLLHGYPGTGKTATAHAIANDCDWAIIEINASDARTKIQLEDFTPQQSMFEEKTCILLDECDSTSKDEKKGESLLTKIVANKQFPVIVTANNLYKVPKSIKDLCEVVQLHGPSVKALKTHLYEIIQKENLKVKPGVLEAAANTRDYRLALTMIENNIILSGSTKNTSLIEYTRQLVVGETSDLKDPKTLLYYLDENCHTIYSTWDLGKIYAILSRVDQLRRRNQIEWANNLLKTIPKTTLIEFEIVAPIKYNKKSKEE